MQCNVSQAERIFRFLLGLGIISLISVGPKTLWAWFGLIPLLTGLLGWCPLYWLLKLNTRDEV